MVRRPLVLALLVLAACGGDESPSPGGGLGVGLAAFPDPTGRADYLLDVGTAVVGGQRRAPWTLTNGSDEPLDATIGEVAPPFALEGEPVRTVPAGSRAEVFFSFRPIAEGEAEAIVEVTSARGSHRVRLAGVGGSAALACSPTGVDFGRPTPGETRTRTVTCTNGGPLAETLAIGPIRGTGAAAFRWDLPENGDTRTLAPGEGLAITIDFTPAEPGEYTVAFPVERAHGGGTVATIWLMGVAVAP